MIRFDPIPPREVAPEAARDCQRCGSEAHSYKTEPCATRGLSRRRTRLCVECMRAELYITLDYLARVA